MNNLVVAGSPPSLNISRYHDSPARNKTKNSFWVAIMKVVIFIAIITTFFFSYWLKCQRGLNFSESVSISKYIPFKYLAYDDVIMLEAKGTIVKETFDYSLYNNWLPLSAKDSERVVNVIDSNGRNDSRSLLIKSGSEKSWNKSYRKYIAVQQGDSFSVECLSVLHGEMISASITVALFDANKRSMGWNYFKQNIVNSDTWNKTWGTFSIPSGTKYIKLRLTGKGKGSYRFDNLVLEKTT